MAYKSLNELSQQIHETAINHGWWEEERKLPELVALFHSELSEALEEYREGRPNVWYLCNMDMSSPCHPDCERFHDPECLWRGDKPEGVAVELADCIIRILDYCAHADIDINAAIEAKLKYNETRPYRHGNKRC
jgi:NTP pyrophosphatase (non-canonical NTP hydrolase)